jgi:O-antigen/teichoic acid export membrane protein
VIAKILSQFKESNGDHASQRNGRLLLSIATSVLAKFVAIGSTLITIPVTLNYLGAESFGVWMVISGVVGFMNFSDLGIGMGLQNALSKPFGKDDHISPKHYIVNAYFIVTALASILALLLIAIFSIIPIENLFEISDKNLLADAVTALKYSVLAFLLGMPIALIQRILGGLQKTYVANNVMLVGSVLSLLAIISAVYFDLGLVGLSVLFVLSPTITLLLYSLYFFYKNAEFRPMLRNLSKSYVAPIVSAGAW